MKANAAQRNLVALSLTPVLAFVVVKIGLINGIGWFLCPFLVPFIVCSVAQSWTIRLGLLANSLLMFIALYYDASFQQLLWAYLHRKLTRAEEMWFVNSIGFVPLAQLLSLLVSVPIHIRREQKRD